jgi:hypothetical protein
MSSENRQFTKSKIKRKVALKTAKARNTELVDIGIGYLSTATISHNVKLGFINSFNQEVTTTHITATLHPPKSSPDSSLSYPYRNP